MPPFFRHGKPLRKYQHHGRWQTLPASVPTLRICGVATVSAASASTAILAVGSARGWLERVERDQAADVHAAAARP